MDNKIKTIFFGTPEFAATALKTLAANSRFDVIAVITQPDRPTGRKNVITPPPVKIAAEELKIKILQPEKLKDQAVIDIIALNAELAVVVAYGNLIPKILLEAMPRGFINIHPSLLPRHRGASPLAAAILDGDKETGVCLMVLDEGMDHGPIIACRKIALTGEETTISLRQAVTPIASEMINKELLEYLDGQIMPAAQNHDAATFCKLIESDAARINWNETAPKIDCLIRAMHGVTPAWTTLDGVTLLIHAAKLEMAATNEAPGTIIKIKNTPAATAANGYLILNEVQLAGGKAMSGQAFLNGHRDFIGKTLV